MLRIRLLTVVWGNEFVDRFLKLTFRSLAAPQNLPQIVQRHDVAYDIYAPPEDIARIKAFPLFAALSETVNFRFHPFALKEINAADSMSHWMLWQRAVSAAREEDVYVITVGADHIFADGGIARWVELFEQGYLAIYCPGIQVATETVEEELTLRFSGHGMIALPLPDLFNVMFRHMHPVMITMFRDSPRWMAHPEFHLRAVRGQGFVQNIMTSHAVAFQPNLIDLTPNLCPLDKLDQVAFEPSWYLSSEPILKYLNLYLRRWQMDDATLSHYGVWGEGFFLPGNLIESDLTHVYPIGAEIEAGQRRHEEIGGHFYVGQMKASRQIYRVWRALQKAGLFQAARWLAAAHVGGRLRRSLPVNGPVTLFVPADEILQCLAEGEYKRLMADNCRALVAVVREHVAPGAHALPRGAKLVEADDGAICTMDGKRYAAGQGTNGVSILRGPIIIDDARIYVVDRPLSPVALREETTGDTGAILQRRWRYMARRARAVLRNAAIDLLKRNPRLYVFARDWRDAQLKRQQAAAAARVRAAEARENGASAQPPSEDASRLYRRAMSGQSLAILLELYHYFEERVLAGGPLKTVPGTRLDGIKGGGNRRVIDWLKEAVRLAPDYAEAWLELGFAHLDNGDEETALAAFDRARKLLPVTPRHHAQADQRIVAALEWARLMERRGLQQQALAALDSMKVAPPHPWRYFLWRAGVLVQMGRAQQALDEYERCMEWNHYEGRFQNALPHVIEDIEAQLAT